MKNLVMIGAGHAHVCALASLAAHPLAAGQVTLVAPYPRQVYSGMLPGFVAGHYTRQQCEIDLHPMLQRGGIAWQARSVVNMDALARTLQLDDGSALPYDVLSINSGAVQDRQRVEQSMPGAREHALFVRPIEAFGALWPRVLALAEHRALRVAIIGGGAAGIELACAMAYRLKASSVTLLTGQVPVASNYPLVVRQRIIHALKQRHITLIQQRAVAIEPGAVTLDNGATLACDVPVIAIGAQAPPWLRDSGLALDDQGFVAVDASQRSTSHANVFAAGDVSTRVDCDTARSGVYAVRAGPILTNNLRAAVAGIAPKPYRTPSRTLNLLSCGDRYAIASWGNASAEGRWVWWLKDRIDRGFVRKYTEPT